MFCFKSQKQYFVESTRLNEEHRDSDSPEK